MRFTTSFAVKALTFVFAAGSAQAFWRMPCRARSGLARIDPLISNGTVSEHAHAIHGSSGFSETAWYGDLIAGDCTSCQVSQDKSAYWTPALYFKHASGDVELVDQVGGMLAYYLLYPNAGNDSLSAFPEDFRMIAGDVNQRNFSYPVPDLPKSDWTGNMTDQAFLRQAALGFNCLNYATTPEGSLYRHFLPDKAYLDANCLDGVRFELMFPSCWNGVDSDSPNHKDHVAYPSEVMTGNCPTGYETRLVSLFYETIWNTYAFNGVDGEFYISNADPTGYSYHGDFMMGWDGAFLQEAVNNCTNLSGQIEDCPLFDIQDASVYGNCNITLPSALVEENVVGPVSTLPGNPAIQSGPGYATEGGSGAVATAAATTTGGSNPVPTLSHSAGVTLASSDTYVPGAVFAAQTAASAAYAAPSAAITAAPAAASTDTQSYFSTEYSTSGQVVSEILWLEEIVTITASVTEYMTLPSRKRHVHHHGR